MIPEVKALDYVVRNVDTETQWRRAVDGLKRMNSLEKTRMWVDLSNLALKIDDPVRASVVLSQYKIAYKRAMREAEGVVINAWERLNSDVCDGFDRPLNQIQHILEEMLVLYAHVSVPARGVAKAPESDVDLSSSPVPPLEPTATTGAETT